jgi:hypothetical protein
MELQRQVAKRRPQARGCSFQQQHKGTLQVVLGHGTGRHQGTVPQIGNYRGAGCSLLRAEGFSCSLCVFYGGLSISKFKKYKCCSFTAVNLFSIIGHPGTGSGSLIRKNARSWLTVPLLLLFLQFRRGLFGTLPT